MEKSSSLSLNGSIPQMFEAFLKQSNSLLLQQEHAAPINDSDISLLKQIGKGSFKEVHSAKWNGKDVAYVQFIGNSESREFLSENELKLIDREVKCMRRLGNHPNIVQLLATTRNNNLILELCQGDLIFWLKPDISWNERFRIAIEFLSGLKFSHSIGISHGDLKPQNILISAEGSARLSDFGSMKNVYTSCLRSSTKGGSGGTFGFQGPEFTEEDLLKLKSIDSRCSDIYAAGGVLLFLFSGKSPFESLSLIPNINPKSRLDKMQGKAWEKEDACYPEAEFEALRSYTNSIHMNSIGEKLIELIKNCMNTLPHRRPLINKLIVQLRAIEREAVQLSSLADSNKPKQVQSASKPEEKNLELLPIILDLLVKKFGSVEDDMGWIREMIGNMALNSS
jgi:serine/threonine protein kinase